MNRVAIIPIRTLADGKSRLRLALTDEERQALIVVLLRQTIQTVQEACVARSIFVISPDPLVELLATQAGVIALSQATIGLNAALREATDMVIEHGADEMLAIHADLPLLDGETLQRFVGALDLANDRPAVAIATDRHGRGTNALLMRPPGIIPFAFGEQSFARHQESAWQRNVVAIPTHAPELALDLDTPDDLDMLRREHPARFAALWQAIGTILSEDANGKTSISASISDQER